MKKSIQLLVLLGVLSLTSGYLMSQMSLVGRLGINLVHHEYKFLKVWWQGGLVVYSVLLVLFLLHGVLHRIFHIGMARLVHSLLMLVAIAGLYFTYLDFADDFTHRILRQRFHIGAYLFWVGWIIICLFFIIRKKTSKPIINFDSKAATAQ